jgi:hypothetical protein
MKFLVYISRFQRQTERVRAVGRAVIRIADELKAEIEIRRWNVLAPHVYCIEGEEKRLIYTDWGKNWGEDEVYNSLRKAMLPFSHLPEYASLRPIIGR